LWLALSCATFSSNPASRVTSLRREPFLRAALHHQCETLEFLANYVHGAAGTFHAAGGIERRRRRHTVTTAHEKYLKDFCGVARIHPALQEVVPERRYFHY
jgi:hypothetical protein